jgi:imidazolonepropionase-like amidohydrolase
MENSRGPADWMVVDAEGRLLTPGLIDLHIHPMLVSPLGEGWSEIGEYLVSRAAAAREALPTVANRGGQRLEFKSTHRRREI